MTEEPPPPALDDRFQDAVDNWIIAMKARSRISSDRTEAAYRRDVNRWANAISSDEPTTLDDLTKPNVEGALVALADEGLAPTTRARMLSALRGFCRWATKNAILADDPTDDDELTIRLRKNAKLPSHFTARQIRSILNAIAQPKKKDWARWAVLDKALLSVLLGAGLRASEAVALTPADIATEHGITRIRVAGKGGKTRRVPIDDEAKRALGRWSKARRRLSDKLHLDLERTDPLFVSRKGKPLTRSSLDWRVRSWLRQAGIAPPPGACAHAFRHTYAHGLVTAGKPVNLVQQALGHESLDTTSIYTKAAGTDLDTLVDGPSPLEGMPLEEVDERLAGIEQDVADTMTEVDQHG